VSSTKPIFDNVIYQTTKEKQKIPQKVYNNIQKYAPGYRHIVFDDDECREFLGKHYGQQYVDRFNNLNLGAHKADFFRYCLLYKKGGIYLDIKTELIGPVNEIFTDRTKLYSVLQNDKKGIHQGVLASPPGHPIFLELIEYVLKTDPSHYHQYVHDFYNRLQDRPRDDIILFDEVEHEEKECGGLDRYGLCCFILRDGKKIIKTRFNDYPW
jgi:mannosyltransferase OCH1-like enzyme